MLEWKAPLDDSDDFTERRLPGSRGDGRYVGAYMPIQRA